MPIYERLHNGKKQWCYRCYYTDFNGDRVQKHSKWFNTRKEAVAAESAFMQIKIVGDQNVTFYEVTLKWYEFKSRTLKPSTLDTKRVYLNMLSPLNDKKIAKITYLDIDNFFELPQIKSYKYSTKKTLLTNLRNIFRFAKKHYGIINDPFFKMSPLVKPVATEAKRLEIVPKSDFKTLFEYAVTCRDGAWKDTAYAIWTMYMTGMRVSECLSLTFEDFDGKYIHIRRQYIRGKWQTPKTKNSIRKIAVDEKTKSFIYELKKYYSSFDEFEESWFIFGGYRHMDPEILRLRKNKLCAEVGIPEFNIHALRHSHASNLIEAGVNMYKISKRLGHSSIRTTMDIYGHLIDTEEEEILNAISNF